MFVLCNVLSLCLFVTDESNLGQVEAVAVSLKKLSDNNLADINIKFPFFDRENIFKDTASLNNAYKKNNPLAAFNFIITGIDTSEHMLTDADKKASLSKHKDIKSIICTLVATEKQSKKKHNIKLIFFFSCTNGTFSLIGIDEIVD